MSNPLDRAAPEALLKEADRFHADHRSCWSDRPNAKCRTLACRLAAALRDAHAALDGATVERVCACGHGEPHHFGEDAKRCAACVACDAFQPTHERVTVTRALPEGGIDARG